MDDDCDDDQRCDNHVCVDIPPEVCALGTPDEDGDGKSNYDDSDGLPFDPDCPALSLNNIALSKSTILSTDSFSVSCDVSPADAAGVNSVYVDVQGPGSGAFSCDDDHPSWSGSKVTIDCSTSGASPTDYDVYCVVDGSRSPTGPGSVSGPVTLTVAPGVTCYPDVDGDSYGNSSVAGVPKVSCPSGMVFDNTDCDDANASVHPGAVDVCNGKDDDCDASTLDGSGEVAPPLTGDGFSASYGVCVGYNQSCVGGSWVNNYSLVPGYESPESSCDGLDNDCDGYVDEGTSGVCYYPLGVCSGLLNCSADFVEHGSCAVSAGCSEVPGVCDDGVACDSAHPCAKGDCHGLSCEGFVNCAGLNTADCQSHHGAGCSLVGCDGYHSLSNVYGNGASCSDHPGCEWNCSGAVTVEICSNGKDDDLDGLVDCLDDDCRFVSVATADVPRYNCLGTDQTGDVTGNAYYCGVSDTDPAVGLCCQAGQKPEYDAAYGLWYCQDYDPCRPSPPYTCDYDYSTQFVNWSSSVYSGIGSDWCVYPAARQACCKVVAFGNEEYYSDTGNVVIY